MNIFRKVFTFIKSHFRSNSEKYIVYRGGDYMKIGKKYFDMREMVKLTDKKLDAHVEFPSQYRPPWFRTGSPYGKALLSLGAKELSPPSEFRFEYVPHCGPITKIELKRSEIWAKVFGINPELYFDQVRTSMKSKN